MVNITHYGEVILGMIASQITSLTIVYSTVYSDADQRKHQSSASLAFLWGIQRGPVNSSHKWPVMQKMFPFDDVIKRSRRPVLKMKLVKNVILLCKLSWPWQSLHHKQTFNPRLTNLQYWSWIEPIQLFCKHVRTGPELGQYYQYHPKSGPFLICLQST